LTASVLEAAARILGFSVRSKDLKGTYVKVLRDASAAIAVGTTFMAKRMAMIETGESLEILEELREGIQRLRTSLEAMGKEVEDLKE
ncbi:hypothetical protein EAI_15398, partial [Harpegnathos saltator]